MAPFLFSINDLTPVVAAVIRQPNMAKQLSLFLRRIGILAESITPQAQNSNPMVEYADVDFSAGVFIIPDNWKMIGVTNQLVF